MQLHEVYVKIPPQVCLAIHNQLRGIHYQTITPPRLKLLAILLPPLLFGVMRVSCYALRSPSVSRLRFNPSTSAVASLSPSSGSLSEVLARDSRTELSADILKQFLQSQILCREYIYRVLIKLSTSNRGRSLFLFF